MRSLGNEKQNALSRKWTKALRKADKSRGRQKSKKELANDLSEKPGNGESPILEQS